MPYANRATVKNNPELNDSIFGFDKDGNEIQFSIEKVKGLTTTAGTSNRQKDTTNEKGYYLIPFDFDWTNIPENYANCILEVVFNFDLNQETITLPDNVTIDVVGGFLKNGVFVGSNTTILNNGNKIFHISSITFNGSFNTKVTPYMFGVDGVNDQLSLNRSISAAAEMDCKLEWIGNFNADTVTFNNSVEINTNCTIQSTTDNNVIVIQGTGNGYTTGLIKITHTGFMKLFGTSRTGSSVGILLNNGVLNSSFDKVYIANTALAVKYGTVGNNNNVSWDLLDIASTGKSYLTTFTKASTETVVDIGEITTTVPINVSTGIVAIGLKNAGNTALTTAAKTYPIVLKPGTTQTYYVGGFTELQNGGDLAYFTGGGVHHTDHTDNGAIKYNSLNLFSIDGISINVQSFYGVTVDGGKIEGVYTLPVIGGVRINKSNNTTPERIWSIRSLFSGMHTEANLAQEPLVYTNFGANVVFSGNLIAAGIRTITPETGVTYGTNKGTSRSSNIYHINGASAPITPIDPTFKIYREVASNTTLSLNLANLKTDMSYLYNVAVNHATVGEVNLLNIPAGVTRRIIVTPSGTNTLMGGTSAINIDIVGVEGKTTYKVTFVLVDNNFTYFSDTHTLGSSTDVNSTALPIYADNLAATNVAYLVKNNKLILTGTISTKSTMTGTTNLIGTLPLGARPIPSNRFTNIFNNTDSKAEILKLNTNGNLEITGLTASKEYALEFEITLNASSS